MSIFTPEQRAVLQEQADREIHARERQAAKLDAKAVEEAAEAARVHEGQERIAGYAASRLEIVRRAERGFRLAVEALADLEAVDKDIGATVARYRFKPSLTIETMAMRRRMSERIASLFRALAGTGAKFGTLQFHSTARKPTDDWVAEERRAMGLEFPFVDNGAELTADQAERASRAAVDAAMRAARGMPARGVEVVH